MFLVWALESTPRGGVMIPTTRAAQVTRTIPEREMEKAGRGPRASDGNLGTVAHERALVHYYGLTRQEASLAVRLIQGLSLDEAAATLSISSGIARTCLKRIIMKAAYLAPQQAKELLSGALQPRY